VIPGNCLLMSAIDEVNIGARLKDQEEEKKS
jgi:hypothetical protein